MQPDEYLNYHGRRFDYVENVVKRLAPRPDNVILDVGAGPLSERLRQHYGMVWTLGLESTAIFEGSEQQRQHHITFDLNHASEKARWIELPRVDIVVFSEVIEHLFCDPVTVLQFLATALKSGGIIICTTPNITAFHKRVRAVFGKTPWHRWESGHVTEFEKDDLLYIGRAAGLQPVMHEFANYFGVAGSPTTQAIGHAVDTVTGVVPTFRRGQTIVLAKTSGAA